MGTRSVSDHSPSAVALSSGKVLNAVELDYHVCDRARRSRDPRFDGRFFIAVTSTRIYCRPICPVRAPKDEHIRYFRHGRGGAGVGVPAVPALPARGFARDARLARDLRTGVARSAAHR